MSTIIEEALECTSFEGLSRLLTEGGYAVPEQHYQAAVEGYRKSLKMLGLDGILGKGSEDITQHQVRVAVYAAACAEELKLGPKERRATVLGAHHHDCGKIAFDHTLINGGSFTPPQKRAVQAHSIFGAYILNTGHEGDILVAEAVGYHHENVDGSGYVDGLKGEEIPIAARILRIVDSFDCMRSEKSYAKQRTVAEALGELHAHEGREFDSDVLALFQYILQNDEKIKEIVERGWTKIFYPPKSVSRTDALKPNAMGSISPDLVIPD